MKVRLTEEKLRSVIRQTLKEWYGKLVKHNSDGSLWDPIFLNTTKEYLDFVQDIYDDMLPSYEELQTSEEDYYYDSNCEKRDKYLCDLIKLLNEVIYAQGVDN